MKSLKKNHTLEALLGSRVPLNELTPELYLEAKDARISDEKIIKLCRTNQGDFYQFKKQHDLMGITVPGYENSSIRNRENKTTRGPGKEEEQTVTIVEGIPHQSIITADNAELQIQLSIVTQERDNLEKLLLEKDFEINRLNDQASQLQEYLNEANQVIRQLEAENEQLHSIGALSDLALEEDNRALQEQLLSSKGIIKQLAALI